jgi:hypothetical protein
MRILERRPTGGPSFSQILVLFALLSLSLYIFNQDTASDNNPSDATPIKIVTDPHLKPFHIYPYKTLRRYSSNFSSFAFATFITTASDIKAAVVLGYTIQKNSGYFGPNFIPPAMILMYINYTFLHLEFSEAGI